MLIVLLLLYALALGIQALVSGQLLPGRAALYLFLALLALHLLYILWMLLVSLQVDESKPIEKKVPQCRAVCNSIALWLGAWSLLIPRLKGEERLPEGRFLLVSNHRSMFDPVTTAVTLRRYDLSFLSKASNMRIPIAARAAYGCGFLSLDRSNDRSALKTILTAADYLKRDVCSMVVYPEGTRSRTGKLLPFHAGSFKIAQRANVPLVIAVVRGSERVRRRMLFLPTRVTLEILECLPGEQVRSMSTQELAHYSRQRMAEALGAEVEE